MSAYISHAPWLKRPSLNFIAAPVARLLSLARPERRVPHDYREIEKFRLELEMKRANVDLHARFKVM
jgi:hypothetical protein